MTTVEYIARWNSFKTLKKRLQSGPTPDVFHLITTGHLMDSEREAFGFLPRMGCAHCGTPVDLILNREPFDFFKAKDVTFSLVWGRDVTVICRKCSFNKSVAA